MKLTFATHNKGKVAEARAILALPGMEIRTADDAGAHEEIPETGTTLEENALQKARYLWKKIGGGVFSDDTGLCIDALNGEPGIRTARWAGTGATGAQIVAHTLARMEKIPEGKRAASFISIVAFIDAHGVEHLFKGEVSGGIASFSRGVAHDTLPYDILFIPAGEDRTFGEMKQEEKNTMSPRGIAFRKLKAFLQTFSHP